LASLGYALPFLLEHTVRLLTVLQNRMLDLKYSMQHLLARMLHKTNPKASLKAVDGMILDVEA
jgi:hypothetical protein